MVESLIRVPDEPLTARGIKPPSTTYISSHIEHDLLYTDIEWRTCVLAGPRAESHTHCVVQAKRYKNYGVVARYSCRCSGLPGLLPLS